MLLWSAFTLLQHNTLFVFWQCSSTSFVNQVLDANHNFKTGASVEEAVATVLLM